MITRPLDLLSRLRKPPANFDAFYFVNAALIGLFFFVFGSRFVIAPGIVMGDTPSFRELQLPSASGAASMGSVTSEMINVMGRDVVITEDGKRTLEEFRRWIAQRGAKPSLRQKVLLVRADVSVSVQDSLAIFEAAQKAGYKVVLAVNEAEGRKRE